MVRRHLAGTVGVCLSEEQHDEIMGAVSAIEAERDTLMADTWQAYIETGADTDGRDRWHCAPGEAGRALLCAVRQLRADYRSACAENRQAVDALREIMDISFPSSVRDDIYNRRTREAIEEAREALATIGRGTA